MILRAKQEQNVLVFELEGTLDFETTHQLSQTCQNLMTRNECTRVVFDFEKLKFVGSSGIHQFVDVLKEFNAFKEKPRLCHLSVEFEKILRAFQSAKRPFAVFLNRVDAMTSFDNDKPLKAAALSTLAPKPKVKAAPKKAGRARNN